MKVNYLLLALMVAITHEAVRAHIVTTSHMDLPHVFCMKEIGLMVTDRLCPIYGLYEDMDDSEFPLTSREVARQVKFERIAKICCTRSCSLTELLSIC